MKRTPKFKPFRSPVLKKEETDESAVRIQADIEQLEKDVKASDEQINMLHDSGLHEDEMQEYIGKLHRYNETKDVAQALLGKLAEMKGVALKELYAKFSIDQND